jgi:hypothetical protein
MLRETITLDKALQMEEKGEITIYHPNTINSIFLNNLQWVKNWNELRQKYRKISLTKLPEFIDFEYVIEHKDVEKTEPYTVSWVYMYGKRASAKVKLDENNSKGQYVYILTNVAYPGICKIGKAVTPSKRIKQINGAGTVSEWELKYALPVSDDYKVEKLIHKELEHLRMSSFQGSRREFFEIEFEEAVKVLENLGEVFAIANPILY